MPPKRKDKGKGIAKDADSQKTSKEPQSTASKENYYPQPCLLNLGSKWSKKNKEPNTNPSPLNNKSKNG